MGRILVAEDSKFIRERLVYLLEGKGHQVTACFDAPSAFSEYSAMQKKGEPPDLIITDGAMPPSNTTGPQLIKAIKEGCTDKGVEPPTFILHSDLHWPGHSADVYIQKSLGSEDTVMFFVNSYFRVKEERERTTVPKPDKPSQSR